MPAVNSKSQPPSVNQNLVKVPGQPHTNCANMTFFPSEKLYKILKDLSKTSWVPERS